MAMRDGVLICAPKHKKPGTENYVQDAILTGCVCRDPVVVTGQYERTDISVRYEQDRFIRVVVWGNETNPLAQTARMLKKGDFVTFFGAMKYSSYIPERGKNAGKLTEVCELNPVEIIPQWAIQALSLRLLQSRSIKRIIEREDKDPFDSLQNHLHDPEFKKKNPGVSTNIKETDRKLSDYDDYEDYDLTI